MPLVLPFSPYHAIKSRKLTVFWVSVTREFKLFVFAQTVLNTIHSLFLTRTLLRIFANEKKEML